VKKGCLLWLLQLVVLVGLYYYAFHGRYTPPADWIGALAGGFFLLLSIGAFQNAFRARKNRARLDGALSGAPFADGQQVAAIGPIAALGAPIESPFTRTPSVICSWDISHEGQSTSSSSSSDNTVRDFAGYTMTPCVVNAPGGTARILGFATLEGFKQQRTGPEAFANAESYLRSTTFEKLGLLQVFSQVKDLLTDDDGYIRKDWRMAGEDFVLDPAVHTLNEEVVEDGETVCALGLYSAEKGGLGLGLSKGGEGLTLIRGGVEAAKKRIKGNVGQNILAGIMVLLASHFFLFMILFLREPSVRAQKLEVNETAFLDAARNGDLAGVQAQLGRRHGDRRPRFGKQHAADADARPGDCAAADRGRSRRQRPQPAGFDAAHRSGQERRRRGGPPARPARRRPRGPRQRAASDGSRMGHPIRAAGGGARTARGGGEGAGGEIDESLG